MSKKTIIIALLIAVVAITAVVFFLTRPLSLSLEQMFPSQALIYGRLSNVKGDLQQFSQTSFWKSISTIDLPLVLEHNKALPEDIQELRNIKKELEMLLKNPLTEKLLGKELALGLYERETIQEKGSLKSYEALFATRLGVSLQMAELLVSVAHQWSDDVSTTIENYQGFKIVHVHFNKKKLDIAYVRIKDVLFASVPSSRMLYQMLDVYRKKKVSLSADPHYSKAVEQAYSKGHGILYINIQRFYDMFRKHLPAVQKSQLDQISGASVGFKSYLVSFLPGDISKLKFILHFDSQNMGSYWQSLLKCSPSDNQSLKFVPYNVVAYQWGQCYDFKDIWNQIPSSQTWANRLEKRFKINVEQDVLPVLGSQVGAYLNDVDIQSLYPYPRGIVFIKIENRLAAENLLKKLTENPITTIQQEQYQKADIHYITLPFGANMDPGYAFLGDYLLLGSSRQLLKTSIDAFDNPSRSLQSDEILKQFNITGPNQGMAFVKMDILSQKLQNILNWYNKIVSSQIGMALNYQQEAGGHKKELAEAISSKSQEISLAQKKLAELTQKMATPALPIEEQETRQKNLEHLKEQVKLLKEDLVSYQQQQEQLQEMLINYQNQSEYAKLWLFNSDEIFMPILKGLEGLKALGLHLRLRDQISETEIFIQ